ncbi:MAG TPA: hypothetical protein VEC99_13800 [Clostridia bacterium]|nr:hypothetical protein [Clostridia bacterium]
MYEKPEQQARHKIDAQLAAAGWLVQERRRINLHAAPGIALCETDVAGGFADYMLFVDGKAIGVLEAKAAQIQLVGTSEQSELYARAALTDFQRWDEPYANQNAARLSRHSPLATAERTQHRSRRMMTPTPAPTGRKTIAQGKRGTSATLGFAAKNTRSPERAIETANPNLNLVGFHGSNYGEFATIGGRSHQRLP